MKTFEEYSLKDKFFMGNKKEDDGKITYDESPPVTIKEILDKFGGIDNFNFKETARYLGDQYIGKKVKFVSSKGVNELDSVIRVTISVWYDDKTNTNKLQFVFYTDSVKFTIGENTKIITIIKRKINLNDPYGEEEWEINEGKK